MPTAANAQISSLTLTRLYAVHVVLGPILLALLIGFHIYLVILHGTLASAEIKEEIDTAEEQREMISYLHAIDPYRHNIVVHTFPGQQDKVYTWPHLISAEFIALPQKVQSILYQQLSQGERVIWAGKASSRLCRRNLGWPRRRSCCHLSR